MFAEVFRNGWRWTVSPVLAARQQFQARRRWLGFYTVLIFAVLFALAAYVLWAYKIPIGMPAILPIVPADYYIWQAAFTIPWTLACWALSGGLAWGLLKAFGGNAGFREWLDFVGPATVVPWFYLTLLPDLIGKPFAGPGGFPLPVATMLTAVPLLWMMALVIVAARLYLVRWPKAVGVAVLYTVVFSALLLLLVR
jgi:hypothetical protein